MARSISIVEYKVGQSRFFLEQIPRSGFDFFAAQCFTDAFAAACRSITFSMQAVNTVLRQRTSGIPSYVKERRPQTKTEHGWELGFPVSLGRRRVWPTGVGGVENTVADSNGEMPTQSRIPVVLGERNRRPDETADPKHTPFRTQVDLVEPGPASISGVQSTLFLLN